MLKVFTITTLLFLLNSFNFGIAQQIKAPAHKTKKLAPQKDFYRTKRCFVWLPMEELNKTKNPTPSTAR
tara:strand:+ start:4288 stop:4494 length:207 start_codon:yes stop_codon:yes gene_type:complete